MSLTFALKLADEGFHVFPLVYLSKLPAIHDFPSEATRDPEKIKQWWVDPVLGTEKPFNVGISTTKFKDGESLLVVDVDNKGDKKGDEQILRLEIEGRELHPTYEQRTPTGGRHIVYRVKEPVKQGTNVLGAGLDIRARGGYIVGAGSRLEGGTYSAVSRDIALAPEWLISSCGRVAKKERKEREIDSSRAVKRATEYLVTEAPLSVEGEGGDETAFLVACRLKDFGVTELECQTLLEKHWNAKCTPPWSDEALRKKVENAYRYGQEQVGSSAPEADFGKLSEAEEKEFKHPFQVINKEYAFVIAGGGSHILWETVDHKGVFKVEHLNTATFHDALAARMLSHGDGEKPISKLWMRSEQRRSYDGLCFMPGLPAPERFYNLWRGFAFEPIREDEKSAPGAITSLNMFLEHAKLNVCQGDMALYRWLIGYFAHLIQKPWEKPLVALVFRGRKGVGKNALVERIGALLGSHFLVSSDRRYLVGNFNGHLENALLFTLDEAFWSGDKQAEGVLKNLITGKSHIIEHKGKEPYTVENCTRVAIIGNEDWLVPATHDERRFAVFNVGQGRKQDREFFRVMRVNMEKGGYRLLLKYLLDFDISSVDVDQAPLTSGLLDQKVKSLEPVHQWWLDCLEQGRVVGSDFGNEWPEELSKERFREAFKRHCMGRNIRTRLPDDSTLGRLIRDCLPSLESSRQRASGERIQAYKFPVLDQAREEWSQFIGHEVVWE